MVMIQTRHNNVIYEGVMVQARHNNEKYDEVARHNIEIHEG